MCRSELFESGWVKNTSLGEGSWGGKSGMEKLMGQQEAEGTVTIKSGRDRVAELKVVARVSSPLGNHASLEMCRHGVLQSPCQHRPAAGIPSLAAF